MSGAEGPVRATRVANSGGSLPGRSLAWLFPAGLAYVASRAPLMVLGFGSDGDAWSLAGTAVRLVRHGQYRVSRAPGHPVQEAIHAMPIAFGGPLASNALTLLFSLVLLAVLARLGRVLGVPRPYWAVAMLAVHPLFWITSADSTDFMLAALFGTAALLAATSGSWRWAGVLLGLGMGTRMEIAVFALPLIVLSRDRLRWGTLAVAALTGAASYLPVLLAYHGSPWQVGDLYTSRLDPATRAKLLVGSAWAATGLVPGLAVAGALFAHSREIVHLARRKDPLLLGAASLAGGLLLVTIVHPGKPTYYVPLLPLAVLALTRVAPLAWRVILLLSFLSHALVYPDVIDQVCGSVSFGFRLNNGLVVKDWVARWNATQAAAMLEENRPSDCDVMVLGYWLPMWRWEHLEAAPIEALAPGVRVDPRTNAAFLGRQGVRSVHNLDRLASAALRQQGMRLCYGEGIDGFMREAHGYDIREFEAAALRTRDLGHGVFDRFALPTLLRCGLGEGRWRECVRSRLEDTDTEGPGDPGHPSTGRIRRPETCPDIEPQRVPGLVRPALGSMGGSARWRFLGCGFCGAAACGSGLVDARRGDG